MNINMECWKCKSYYLPVSTLGGRNYVFLMGLTVFCHGKIDIVYTFNALMIVQ